MPYVMVEPDVAFEHAGVTVFCTYSDGDASFPCRYWYTTNPKNADECHGHGSKGHFDARMLVGRWSDTPNVAEWNDYWRPRFRTEDECIEALVKAAIDDGKVHNWDGD